MIKIVYIENYYHCFISIYNKIDNKLSVDIARQKKYQLPSKIK